VSRSPAEPGGARPPFACTTRTARLEVTWTVVSRIARPALEAALLLAAVSVLTFVLLNFSSGDVATAIVQRRDGDVTTSAIQAERVELGLDRSLPHRYLENIRRAAHGDLGTSLLNGEPVADEIASRVAPTARLAGAGALVAVLGGLTLGMLGVLVGRRWTAQWLRLAMLATLSVPSFALAYLGVLVFGLWWHLLPTQGTVGPRSLVLPALVLGLPLAAALGRVTEARLRSTMSEPYITTARARGLSEPACLLRHALPNAAASLLVVFGNHVGYAIAGTLVVETIFGWPGLGAYLVQSLQLRDWYPLQASVLVVAAAAIGARGVAGSLAVLVDPRTAGQS